MAFAYKITAEQYDGLDEGFKGAYKKQGDEYVLDIEGLPEPEDVSGLKSKVDELLREKKAAAKKAEEAEKERLRIEREKAEKEQDYKSLFESSEQERGSLIEQLNGLKTGIAQEKLESTAMAIASQIAEGKNAKLLKTFVRQRLNYTEDGIQVLSSDGKPTVATLEDLQKEIVNSGEFDSLIKGNKSSGGGADAGNKSGGATVKTVTRAEFDAMDDYQRSQHAKSGGKVTDE